MVRFAAYIRDGMICSIWHGAQGPPAGCTEISSKQYGAIGKAVLPVKAADYLQETAGKETTRLDAVVCECGSNNPPGPIHSSWCRLKR